MMSLHRNREPWRPDSEALWSAATCRRFHPAAAFGCDRSHEEKSADKSAHSKELRYSAPRQVTGRIQ